MIKKNIVTAFLAGVLLVSQTFLLPSAAINPTINSISPNLGSIAGGQEVTLTGANFDLKRVEFKQVAVGSIHSLALTESGDIYAWGDNLYGKLGNGTIGSGTNQSTPVKVSQDSMTASGKVIQIAAAFNHSLALTESGDIYAWGRNNYGQLGNGNTTNQSTPVKVSQDSMTASGKVTQLAAGYYHSLVLTESGDIYAWGWNNYGQLGNGNTTNQSAPAKVSQSSMTASGKVTQIVAGNSHSLVLTESGDIYAWGWNNYGQLGNGTSGSGTNQSAPVKVSQSSMTASGEVAQLAAAAGSSHSLVLTESGDVYAWGHNSSGQLGNGTSGSGTNQSAPIKIPQDSIATSGKITQLVAGNSHSLALTESGNIYAWGYNFSGQLGDGTSGSGTDKSTPVKVLFNDLIAAECDMGLDKVTQLAAGNSHSIALTESGDIYAWGRNDQGQLGNGATTSQSTPVKISQDSMTVSGKVTQLAAGYYHSLALTESGDIYAWGENSRGELGNGDNVDQFTPVKVFQDSMTVSGKVTQLAAGLRNSLALTESGDIYAWGYNFYGQLGNGSTTDQSTPIKVSQDNMTVSGKVIQIASGQYHSLALTESGDIYAWGNNSGGQLGNNNTIKQSTPVKVSQDSMAASGKATQLAAGYRHSLALTESGDVYAWGSNSYGQLGNGTSGSGTDQSTPIKVSQDNMTVSGKAIQVASGYNHSLALTESGDIFAWGQNGGRLGNDDTANQSTPVKVFQDSITTSGKVTQLAALAGSSHSLVLTESGDIYAWGSNSFGQLGNGTTTSQSTPVKTDFPSVIVQCLLIPPRVDFGGTAALSVTVVDSNTIKVTTPPHAAGVVDVTVDLGDGDSSYLVTAPGGYTYADVPTAPLNLTATPSASGVQLDWDEPSSNGGAPILSYSVEYSTDGVTWQAYDTVLNKTTTVPNSVLDNPTIDYHFRVAASNVIGQGAHSNTVQAKALYLTLSSSSNTINIDITPTGSARMSSGSHDVTVSTNSVSGYDLSLRAATATRDLVSATGGYTISPIGSLPDNPGILVNQSLSQWGFRVDGKHGFGSGTVQESNKTSSSFKWAGIPQFDEQPPLLIDSSNSPAAASSTKVWYGASVTPTQAQGVYSQTVTYTLIAG